MARQGRRLPLQSGKAGVITIIGDPLATPLDRESREPRVTYPRALYIRFQTEAFENFPMAFTWFNDLAVRLPDQAFTKRKSLVDRARHPVRARIGSDANHCAQHQWRNAEPGIARDRAPKPGPRESMWRNVVREGVDQDVDVRQNHLKRFMRSTYSRSSISCNAEKSMRSIPSIGPPVALLTGGITRFIFSDFLLLFTRSLRPSSISDVSVRPSAAALRLARIKSSLGRRTVVRSFICRDISVF